MRESKFKKIITKRYKYKNYVLTALLTQTHKKVQLPLLERRSISCSRRVLEFWRSYQPFSLANWGTTNCKTQFAIVIVLVPFLQYSIFLLIKDYSNLFFVDVYFLYVFCCKQNTFNNLNIYYIWYHSNYSRYADDGWWNHFLRRKFQRFIFPFLHWLPKSV